MSEKLLRDALQRLAQRKCDKFGDQTTCWAQGLESGSAWMANRVCDPCEAREALASPEGVKPVGLDGLACCKDCGAKATTLSNRQIPLYWFAKCTGCDNHTMGQVTEVAAREAWNGWHAARPAPVQERATTPDTIALRAWQSRFGTTQLSHAFARLEAAESEVLRLRALASRPVPEAVGLPEGCPETMGFSKDGAYCSFSIHEQNPPLSDKHPGCAPEHCHVVEIHPTGTREAMERMREALEPFAEFLAAREALGWSQVGEDLLGLGTKEGIIYLKWDHLRAASAALSPTQQQEEE